MKLSALLEATAARLRPVSGEDAAAEARELVSFALGRRVGFSNGEAELTEKGSEALEALIARRLAHEPLQYIIGEWDLMGLTFRVTEAVLIPRQDTETLVVEAERLIRTRGYRTLLDICTGSGCIGLALAVRTGADAALSDISEAALEVARSNAKLHGVRPRIVKSDLFSAFGGEKFDIITVNPPYIPTKVVGTLAREVQREPAIALDGGADGLVFYRRIRAEFENRLNPGGALVMEIGYDQGATVPALFESCGTTRVLKDLGGNDRVVVVEPRGEMLKNTGETDADKA